MTIAMSDKLAFALPVDGTPSYTETALLGNAIRKKWSGRRQFLPTNSIGS